mgnify:CR=1 FL=1
MTALQQLAWHTENSKGVRVPRLDKAPAKYNDLYISLGMARFIKSFRAKEGKNSISLQLILRDEEICNLVVIARLKQIFKGVAGAKFPKNFERQPINIQIPR